MAFWIRLSIDPLLDIFRGERRTTPPHLGGNILSEAVAALRAVFRGRAADDPALRALMGLEPHGFLIRDEDVGGVPLPEPGTRGSFQVRAAAAV